MKPYSSTIFPQPTLHPTMNIMSSIGNAVHNSSSFADEIIFVLEFGRNEDEM